MNLEPGIYRGVPDAEYRAWPAISQSGLKTMLKSPAKFRHEQTHPRKRTPAMLMGSLVDCLCLEPEAFDLYFEVAKGGVWPNTVCPKCGAAPGAPCLKKDLTPAAKVCTAERRENDERPAGAPTLIDSKTLLDARQIADAVLSHPTAGRLVASTEHQVSMVWQDSATGIWCKGRIDCLDADRYIADLKKTGHDGACPQKWPKQVVNWGHDVQAAFYTDAYELLTGKRLPWLWVAVEEEEPFDLAVYQAADEWFKRGRRLYRKALDLYANCVQTDNWTGYDDGVQMCEPPTWALRDDCADDEEEWQ